MRADPVLDGEAEGCEHTGLGGGGGVALFQQGGHFREIAEEDFLPIGGNCGKLSKLDQALEQRGHGPNVRSA